jgi:hypothetical protein
MHGGVSAWAIGILMAKVQFQAPVICLLHFPKWDLVVSLGWVNSFMYHKCSGLGPLLMWGLEELGFIWGMVVWHFLGMDMYQVMAP